MQYLLGRKFFPICPLPPPDIPVPPNLPSEPISRSSFLNAYVIAAFQRQEKKKKSGCCCLTVFQILSSGSTGAAWNSSPGPTKMWTLMNPPVGRSRGEYDCSPLSPALPGISPCRGALIDVGLRLMHDSQLSHFACQES